MDKRKNILIIDLRDVEDNELVKFIDNLSCNHISWVWLDVITKEYECPKIKHLHGCNCCDGVAELKHKIKKKLDKEKGDFNA